MLLANLCNNCELLLGLQLSSAGTDDVKAAGVAVLVDIFVVKDDIAVFKQTAGAALEAVENVVLVGCLQSIVQTADNVVAAGSLAAGKDNAYLLSFCLSGVSALLEGDLVLTVGVGEQRSRKYRFSAYRAAWGHTDILPSGEGKVSWK